ncbi:MAG: hypothetical protein DCC56_11150 [Anaerolineae bacterium]|nr:MAG: hypothetical protein DCC56_11150 [Anaerolineae bacterium]WKZ45740.1 MAG: DUF2652 domain-containing protein [Anaerolineales bacterium]
MANKGYFIITDISGYTEFLTRSELDHANEILLSLFDAQLKNIQFPLKISGFRGDAIFMYTPEACFINPQSFVETLENLYVIFVDMLRQMQVNTTCPCRACRNMGTLDLKMCIHCGEYMVQKLGDREELVGADVIIPHRMLKNNVTEKTGVKAYALFTDAAAQALRLSELSQPLISHAETYEHLGEVKMQVFDLSLAWTNWQAKNRQFVAREDAWIIFELDLPYPASLVWDYLTNPDLEAGFLNFDYAERIDTLGGRVREEAGFHCAHGEVHFYNKIVDWKPFEYYTMSQEAMGLNYLQTRRLIPIDNGTRFALYISKPVENPPDEVRKQMQESVDYAFAGLKSYIEKDIANGKATAS